MVMSSRLAEMGANELEARNGDTGQGRAGEALRSGRKLQVPRRNFEISSTKREKRPPEVISTRQNYFRSNAT
jgi:hypothetical protein